MPFLSRLRTYLAEHFPLPTGSVVLLGVSGGPDSLGLLEALTQLAPEVGWQLAVAYVNHGLRPEAQAEAVLVQTEAEKRGWSFLTTQLDTRTTAAAQGLSLEDAARQLRYAFFAQTAQHLNTPYVAVAHNADDQAETVLMRFLRGSGLRGLRGMRPISPLPGSAAHQLLRPLLWATRAEIVAYNQTRGLTPSTDASNADVSFWRNRVRHEVLPALQAHNPNLPATLHRMAEVLNGEHELLEQYLDELWMQHARPTAENVTFDRTAWLSLTLPAQRALLRRAIQHLRAHLRNVDFTPVDAAARWSRTAAPPRQCDLVAGLSLSLTTGTVQVAEWDFAPTDAPQLDDAGRLMNGWQWELETVETWPATFAETVFGPVWVDANQLPGPLQLRPRRPGETYAPLGLGGHQKISDAMLNAKIPAPLRARWPLVCAGEAVVWIPGLRLAEAFKVTEETRHVVKISLIRLETSAD